MAEVLQGSILVLIFALLYTNDLSYGLKTIAKLFAGDTFILLSLLTKIKDVDLRPISR